MDITDKSKVIGFAKSILQLHDEDDFQINIDDDADIDEKKIRSKWDDFKLSIRLRQMVKSMILNKESPTKILRNLCKGLLPEDEKWADNNRESMIKSYPIIEAIHGKNSIFLLSITL